MTQEQTELPVLRRLFIHQEEEEEKRKENVPSNIKPPRLQPQPLHPQPQPRRPPEPRSARARRHDQSPYVRDECQLAGPFLPRRCVATPPRRPVVGLHAV